MQIPGGTSRLWRSRTFAFIAVFLLTFVVTLGILSSLGIIPVPRAQDLADTVPSGAGESTVAASPEYPVKISAPTIGLNQTISNPSRADETTLDQALMQGAVHYPGSGLLNEDGNVLLFGHSSYLPVVYHQAYKTFNGIQNLKVGETITVSSGSAAYDYEVTSVKFAKATDDQVIDLSKNSRRLTLVTCNSFKTKSDRFVVEARFVGKRTL
jgi:LPXTG-site transpeptidase (sortase) family protein